MKRGGPLKRSNPLRPYGKRAKRQAETPRAMDVPQKERRCELADYLACVSTWQGWCERNKHLPGAWVIERHHVFSQRHHDHEWSVVLASKAAHRFCHEFPKIGKLVGMWALHKAGRFDHQAARTALGYDPIAFVGVWLEPSPGEIGEYDGEPMLTSYAKKLIAHYGKGQG